MKKSAARWTPRSSSSISRSISRLLVRERYGEDGVASARPNRRRRDHVRERTDLVLESDKLGRRCRAIAR